MQHVYFCQVLLRQGPFDQRLGNDIDWINHKLISGKGPTGDTFLLTFPTYENKVKFVESGLYLKQTDRLHYQVVNQSNERADAQNVSSFVALVN